MRAAPWDLGGMRGGGVRWGSEMGCGGWCVCVLVCGMAVLLGSWTRGKQENPALVPSTSCSRRDRGLGWRSVFPRGLRDVGTLGVKSRCGAALGSVPARRGEPGAGPGCKWCRVVIESTQGCSMHHPLTIPWDRPQGTPLPLAANARPPCRAPSPSLAGLPRETGQ